MCGFAKYLSVNGVKVKYGMVVWKIINLSAVEYRNVKREDVLKKLSKRFKNIEIVLIENLPYDIALRKKSELDIFIDQLGELGYGISGLESLAMGIPTVCQILPDFEKFLGEHPFVNADEQNLEDVLMELIESPQMRTEFGEKGKLWVRKVHNPVDAIEPLLETYREEGWI